MTPPLSLLQARILDNAGITLLISDICKKLSLRQPTNLPGLNDLVSRINIIINNRDKSAIVETKVVTQPQKATAIIRKPVDPKVQQAFTQLYQRTQHAFIKKLISAYDKYKIPSESEFSSLTVFHVFNV